jgi:hypothetical protein
MILCISFPTQKSPVFTDATQKVNYGEKGHHCINRFIQTAFFVFLTATTWTWLIPADFW